MRYIYAVLYKLVASLAEVDAAAARKKTFGEKAVFRKELTNYNRDEVVMEMQHLKEYLDIFL